MLRSDYGDVFLNALKLTPTGATPYGSTVPSPVDPLAPNYNALLWKKIYTDRDMTNSKGYDSSYGDTVSNDGAFFVVATFKSTTGPTGKTTPTGVDVMITGTDIYNNFVNISEDKTPPPGTTPNRGLIFDQYGNIAIPSVGIWKNPLTPGKAFSPDEPDSNKNKKFTYRRDTVVNSSGKWILMRDINLSSTTAHVYYVLYNPMHGKKYKEFYQRSDSRITEALPQKYCEMMADKTTNPLKTVPPIYTSMSPYQKYGITNPDDVAGDSARNYADISCYVINNRECVNFASHGLTRLDSSDYALYDKMCTCTAGPFAQDASGTLASIIATNTLNSDGESFMGSKNTEKSFFKDMYEKKTGTYGINTITDPCNASFNITNCSMTFIAGDSNILDGGTVQNNCTPTKDCTFYEKDDGCINGAVSCNPLRVPQPQECKPNNLNSTSSAGKRNVIKTVKTQASGKGRCPGTPITGDTNKYTIEETCVVDPIPCEYYSWPADAHSISCPTSSTSGSSGSSECVIHNLSYSPVTGIGTQQRDVKPSTSVYENGTSYGKYGGASCNPADAIRTFKDCKWGEWVDDSGSSQQCGETKTQTRAPIAETCTRNADGTYIRDANGNVKGINGGYSCTGATTRTVTNPACIIPSTVFPPVPDPVTPISKSPIPATVVTLSPSPSPFFPTPPPSSSGITTVQMVIAGAIVVGVGVGIYFYMKKTK